MNLQELLGQVLEQGMAPSAENRIRNAVNNQETGTGGMGGLGGILEALKGAGSAPGQQQTPGADILGNLAGMAKDMFSQTRQGVESGNPLAIGGLAALAGAILGGGGRSLRGAAGAGALALLAKVAFDALKASRGASATQAMPAEVPLGLREPANGAEQQELEDRARLVLLAMVSAAKADGQLDSKEISKISGKLQESGADDETIAFVNRQMQMPLDLDGLIRAVPSTDVGLQVYAASLLAINVDTEGEREYLRRLAGGLGLDPASVAHIHRMMGVPA